MAHKTLTTGIIALAVNTPSASIIDASGGEAPTSSGAADGWALPVSSYSADHILLKFYDVTGGATVTVLAGDNPPAARAGLGNLTITLASTEVKYIVIETSRFMQDDGTIVAYSSETDTRLTAFILPKGA